MVKQIRTVYFFALLVFIVDPAVFAATSSGRVVGVIDGDTIKILVDRKQIKIHLAEIDTPEKRQPYGSKAKRALSDLVVGKTVQVEQHDVDREQDEPGVTRHQYDGITAGQPCNLRCRRKTGILYQPFPVPDIPIID